MKKRILVISLISILVISSITLVLVLTAQTKSGDVTAEFATRVARVTGPTLESETIPNPNQTDVNYGLRATDLGVIWDATTDSDDKKVMLAFGDSYDDGWYGFGGGGDPDGWRGNLLAISKDTDLSDGLSFDSMITEEDNPTYAKEIIFSEHITNGYGDFTAIPTAGITVGNRHFIHYMQIKNWGANGRWNTNFSEIAYSDDEGQNWTKSDVKWAADSKFAQAAFIKEDGYVYMFGTPAGRFDSAYLARVEEVDVLFKESYEYWNGKEWEKNDESAAVAVVEAPISELSVQYNSYYKKYIMMYLNENRYAMVIRTSDSLTEGWSAETVVATGEEYPGLYGGFIHPWTNDSKDLYFVMSEWGPYNVVLMKTVLENGKQYPNLIKDYSFEGQESNTITGPWVVEEGSGGIDIANQTSRAGSNNAYIRSAKGTNTISQTVEVEKNTDYEFSGFMRTHFANKQGSFGVKDKDGNVIQEVKFDQLQEYTKQVVNFNSGDNETVTVFVSIHPSEDTWIQMDDFMLFEVGK